MLTKASADQVEAFCCGQHLSQVVPLPVSANSPTTLVNRQGNVILTIFIGNMLRFGTQPNRASVTSNGP